MNTKNSNFETSFIFIEGETYAIVVTDLVAAQKFVKNHAPDILPNHQMEFPTEIFNQLQVVRPELGETIMGRTMAISYVLEKNNAGITLLKQDSDGVFDAIRMEEYTRPDGTKELVQISCN